MAEGGFSHGRGERGGTGFLGLDQKYIAAIIVAVVLAVAILGAAFLLRPERPDAPSADPREIACIESGGWWSGAWCSH
jgi:hypothetical protein